MTTSPEVRSLRFYAREYSWYIVPTWLFPVYFIAWGIICEWLKLQFDYVLFLFFITVGPPFFGTFLWAARVRKHIPYWRFCFLTMVVPFFIFAAIGLLLAVAQAVFGRLPFQ
jgi:hypothetical protein